MPVFNHQMLRQIRLDLGLTQEQAAAALGVDARTFRRYESGAVNDGADFSVRHPSRRNILRRLCEEFGVAEESSWLLDGPGAPAAGPAGGAPAPAWTPRFTHPLARARHFTGRQEVLGRLLRWHRDEASPERVMALVAVGGAGKTALVERFLRERGPDPGGALVWSFYEDPRAAALLGEALAYFGGPAEKGPGGQAERLLEVLREGPRHLLVLDGLEAVQSEGGEGRAFGELEDPALRRVLRALAAGLGQCRVLVTSRFDLSDLAPWEGQGLCTLHLADLSEAEALAVLRAYGVQGGDGTLHGLLNRVGRHALSVAMAGSYAGAFLGGDPTAAGAALEMEAAEREEPLARRLRGVLSAYTGALSEQERDLLCRLAVLPRGGDLELLVRVSGSMEVAGSLHGLGEAALLRLLRRLGRLGLVSPGPLYTLHPFVRDHFRGLLGVPASRIHELARQRLAASLSGRPGLYPEDPAALDRHEALLEHTLLSGRSLEAWLIYDRALGGHAHLGLRLGEIIRGARLLRLFSSEAGSLASGADPLPGEVRARLAYDLGLYESALGDLRRAERCYLAHLEQGEALGGPWADLHRSLGKRTLAYNTWLRGDLARAALLVEEARQAAREADDAHHLLRALALAGALAHDRGDAGTAARYFAEAQRLEPGPPEARRGLWLAEHHLALGRWQEAEGLLRRNLAGCEQRGWTGLVAHGHVVLGQLALQREETDLAAAAEHLLQARRWTLRTGEVEMTLRCHLLAGRIALMGGRLDEARREAGEGLALARPCGFGLFTIRLLNLLAAADLAAGEINLARGSAEEVLRAASAEGCGYAWGRAEAMRILDAVARSPGAATPAG